MKSTKLLGDADFGRYIDPALRRLQDGPKYGERSVDGCKMDLEIGQTGRRSTILAWVGPEGVGCEPLNDKDYTTDCVRDRPAIGVSLLLGRY
jgi:hypothetical protein